MTSIVPSSGDKERSTSGEGQVEFDNIICFFIEIESVGFDIGEGTSLVKILFDHFEETGSFGFGGECEEVSAGKVETVAGDSDHW